LRHSIPALSFLLTATLFTATLLAFCGEAIEAAESLPVCAKCLNPRVISKTGTGTASAAAVAKVVAEDAAAWCAVNKPHYSYCVQEEVRQGGDGARESFRATANCATGQLHSINGYDYMYAGVWPDGPGTGKPMLRDSGGNIPRWESIRSGTGKARGEWDIFGGYSLSGQWQVLCSGAPAPASAVSTARAVPAAPSLPAAPSVSQASSQAEWLSLCAQCDNPSVFAKSGTGTANSVAQARSHETGNKVYRATANCTTGHITTIQETSYKLAGIWDSSDIGGGRTKWSGPDGQIVGRDNASNGLAISQQWEVLCPGPVSPSLVAQASASGTPSRGVSPRLTETAKPQLPAQGIGRTQPAPSGQTAMACPGKRYCDEVNSFAAIVTDFRPSVYDRSTHLVSATIRFLNKTNRPLILGYVRNAGVAIDEQGNRYVLPAPENVRAIAEITAGRDFDPKFTIQPGQTADARFEFVWKWNGREIIGERAWDIDLTIREVNEVAPGQYRFGQEHALQFKAVPGRNTTNTAPAGVNAGGPLTQVTPGAGAVPDYAGAVNTAVAQPLPSVSASAGPIPAAPSPSAEPDACGGKSRCYDAGPFVAEIVQGSLTHEGNFQDRVVRLNIRFRNKTAEPIILAYSTGTSVLVDNFGNRLIWGSGHDNSVTGMGKVEGNSADPQFVLRPGETRAATFTTYRRRPPSSSPDGTGYTFNVTIAQLAVLYNGQQIRTLREHAMTFPDFSLNGPSGMGVMPTSGRTNPQNMKEAGDALRDIFKKKK
jgi:hypothetical protein